MRFGHSLVVIAILMCAGFAGLISIPDEFVEDVVGIVEAENVKPVAEVEPDDDVNGSYIQWLDGDWVVESDTNLSDEIIDITGDVIVTNSSTLRLSNVTIRFNNTDKDEAYDLRIDIASTLYITDGDNDPSTTDDRSVLTDSIYDVDDGSHTDYRWELSVTRYASLYLNNSLIERSSNVKVHDSGAGVNVHVHDTEFQHNLIDFYVITIDESDIDIWNCSFTNSSDKCFYINGPESSNTVKIWDCTANNSNSFLTAVYGTATLNNISINGSNIAISYSDSDSVLLSDIDVTNSTTTTETVVNIYRSKDIIIENITIDKGEDGLQFSNCYWGAYVRYIRVNVQDIPIFIQNSLDIVIDGGNVTDSRHLKVYESNNIKVYDMEFYDERINGYAISVQYSKAVFENISITDYSNGISVYSDPWNSCQARCKNFTFSNVGMNHFSCEGSNTEINIVNSTMNYPKLSWSEDGATINWFNFAKVHVKDSVGNVPGAELYAIDQFSQSTDLGRTLDRGRALVEVQNMSIVETLDVPVMTKLEPLKINASIENDFIHSTAINYKGYTYVNLTFAIDTYPMAPYMLTATRSGKDVVLEWEALSTDYARCNIYLNDSSGGFNVLHSSGTPITTYTHVDAAENWATLSYNVHCIDAIGQEETNQETVENGDWVVDSHQSASGFNVLMNGSLFIESGGDLELDDVCIQFNVTEDGAQGIRVDGGKMVLNGNGGVMRSTTDLNMTLEIFNDADVTITNLSLLGLGIARPSMLQGRLMQSADMDLGVYVDGSSLTMEDCDILTSVIAVVTVNNSELTLVDCLLKGLDEHGVYVIDSGNITIINTTISESLGTAVYADGVRSLTIDGCYMNRTDHHQLMARYINGNVTITDSIFSEGEADASLTEIEYIYNLSVIDCTFTDSIGSMGLHTTQIRNLKIIDNSFSDLKIGIQTNSLSENNEGSVYKEGDEREVLDGINLVTAVVKDNDLTQMIEAGMYLKNTDNIYFKSISIDNSTLGVEASQCFNLTFDDSDLVDCYDSFFANNADVTIINSSIINGQSTDLILDQYSAVRLLNTQLNQSRIRLKDGLSKVYFMHFVDILVKDYFAQRSPFVEVSVMNYRGETVFNGTTNSSGLIGWVMVPEREQSQSGNLSHGPLQFSAFYGNHTGATFISVDRWMEVLVNITNLGPEVYSFRVEPAFPSTQDDLVVNFTFTDPEGDPQGTHDVYWFVDGSRNVSLDGLLTIPSSYTKKGQLWWCHMKPSDTIDLGTPANSTAVMIRNSKPIASNVNISPEIPDASMDLEVSFDFSDSDGDHLVSAIYTFYRLNNSIYDPMATSFTSILDHNMTSKGETWRVGVKPFDGESYGDEIFSSDKIINNTPPMVMDLQINPLEPDRTMTINASYYYMDIDEDDEDTSVINWFVNRSGEELLVHTGRVLPPMTVQKDDMLHYTICPHDGISYGVEFESQQVKVMNSVPTISNVRFDNPSPLTTDTFMIMYDFYDPDGDPDKTNIMNWHIWQDEVSTYVPSGINSMMLMPGDTVKGQRYVVEIVPFDGNHSGDVVYSDEIVVLNSAPVITDLTITPEVPTVHTGLGLSYSYSDVDDDTDMSTFIRWYKDGVLVPELNDKLNVDPGNMSRGQQWQMEVLPSDGFDNGDMARSDVVTIGNSPPIVTSINISTGSIIPTTESTLTVVHSAIDEDGDTIEDVTIKWYRDFIEVEELRDVTTIDPDVTAKYEFWEVEVSAFDGNDWSKFNRSEPIMIENSAPTLISMIPSDMSLNITEMDNVTFDLDIYDPDEDMLFFKWYLDDDVASEGPVFDWRTDHYAAGEHTVNVTVYDSDERNSYTVHWEWSVYVHDRNRAPVIEMTDPGPAVKTKDDSSVTFTVEYRDDDVDNDVMITWYFDDTLVATSKDTYTYFPSSESIGTHELRVVVDDGSDQTEYEWTVNVVSSEEDNTLLGQSWDFWGIVVQITVLVGTILLGLWGVFKLRQKQTTVNRYIHAMKEAYEKNKDSPQVGLEKIDEVYKEIVEKYEGGKISDNHFLILEKKRDDYVGDLRRSIMDSLDAVEGSPDLQNKLDEILLDGKVTKDEVDNLNEYLAQLDGVSVAQKRKVMSLACTWTEEDSKVCVDVLPEEEVLDEVGPEPLEEEALDDEQLEDLDELEDLEELDELDELEFGETEELEVMEQGLEGEETKGGELDE